MSHHEPHQERVNGYARAMLAVAEAEHSSAQSADELFRFARALDGSDELRQAISDPRVPAQKRQQIVEDLLGGKASDTTVGLVSMAVAAGRGGDLARIIDRFVELSAAAQSRRVARVRSAVALTEDQKSRLAEALARSTGGQVDLKVVVDPSVVGGIVTQIDDTVIDGSLRSRLLKLKEAF